MKGGSWLGLDPNDQNSQKDAWKSCTDSAQCSEWCQAPEGAQPGDKVVGKCYGGRDHSNICAQPVIQGIAGGILCE